MTDTVATGTTPSTRRVARTRGATSGALLVLLGAWAGFAPFIGPLFDFGFTPDKAWHWSAARGWYEVAPGGAIVLGGLVLLAATSRVVITIGAWLAILGGGWLVIGPAISAQVTLGSLGVPLGDNGGVRALEQMAFFYLLGAVVIFLGSAAFGRLSVVTVRDVRVAEQREAARLDAEQAAEREAMEREELQREILQRRAAERDAYERQTAERGTYDRDAYDRDAYDREAYERQAADRNAPGREVVEPVPAARTRVDDDSYRTDVEPGGAHAAEPYAGDVPVTERPAEQARPYDEPYGQQPYGRPGYDQSPPNEQPPAQSTQWPAPPR